MLKHNYWFKKRPEILQMTFKFYLWLQNGYQLYGFKKNQKQTHTKKQKSENSKSIVPKIRQTAMFDPKQCVTNRLFDVPHNIYTLFFFKRSLFNPFCVNGTPQAIPSCQNPKFNDICKQTVMIKSNTSYPFERSKFESLMDKF